MKLKLADLTKVFEYLRDIVSIDGGRPVAVAIIDASGDIIMQLATGSTCRGYETFTPEGSLVFQLAKLSVCRGNYTAAFNKARTALYWGRATMLIEEIHVRDLGACTPPWFSPIAGGVILRGGLFGDIVGAIGVDGREPMGSNNDPLPENHEIALQCAEKISGCAPIDYQSDYLQLLLKHVIHV